MTTTYAWLIEHGDTHTPFSSPRYYGAEPRWVNDHALAIRFARKIDAERVCVWLVDSMDLPTGFHKVVEHGWSE